MYINNEHNSILNTLDLKALNETEILDRAIHAVEREAGARFHVERGHPAHARDPWDAVVRLQPGNRVMLVEVKKWAQHANLGVLINLIKQLPEEGLLAADYVNPAMADKLRQQQVQFIDTAGNAFIDQPPIYIYVTGNRPEKGGPTLTKAAANRAFEPKGLMVIYAFLRHPELVNAPYREIAALSGVAVGTVGGVLTGLKAANHLIDTGAMHRRRLIHRRKLFERWVEAWPEKLKPKQLVGEFIADDPRWWKKIDIRAYDAYWGGEIAAAKYTRYLTPLMATVYLRGGATPLIRDARLRKVTEWTKEEGAQVHLYHAFWHDQLDELNNVPRDDLVDPILVYADLVATGDPRNLEVARRIYDERLAQYFRED